MQDLNNKTHISYCYPDHQELNVVCNKTESKDVGGKVTNWATTIYYSPFSQSNHHVLAYTTELYYNRIFIEDLSNKLSAIAFNVSKGFPGNISSMTITNRYLYVVLKHIKRINIYSLEECLKGESKCVEIGYVNHINMKRLGVTYFSPESVHSSPHHPNIVFIKTSDSIIIIDLSKDNVPRLLTTVRPVSSSLIEFVF